MVWNRACDADLYDSKNPKVYAGQIAHGEPGQRLDRLLTELLFHGGGRRVQRAHHPKLGTTIPYRITRWHSTNTTSVGTAETHHIINTAALR